MILAWYSLFFCIYRSTQMSSYSKKIIVSDCYKNLLWWFSYIQKPWPYPFCGEAKPLLFLRSNIFSEPLLFSFQSFYSFLSSKNFHLMLISSTLLVLGLVFPSYVVICLLVIFILIVDKQEWFFYTPTFWFWVDRGKSQGYGGDEGEEKFVNLAIKGAWS